MRNFENKIRVWSLPRLSKRAPARAFASACRHSCARTSTPCLRLRARAFTSACRHSCARTSIPCLRLRACAHEHPMSASACARVRLQVHVGIPVRVRAPHVCVCVRARAFTSACRHSCARTSTPCLRLRARESASFKSCRCITHGFVCFLARHMKENQILPRYDVGNSVAIVCHLKKYTIFQNTSTSNPSLS